MKIGRNRLSVGKQETKQDEKPCGPERSTKGMVKNLTMLDIIGLGLLTTFQSGLFHNMLIELDNRNEKDDGSA